MAYRISSYLMTLSDAYSKPFQIWFLPHDAMLARYMLSSCVRPSVCHKSEFYEDG